MFHETWGILICVHDRDWKYIFPRWKWLFSISCFLCFTFCLSTAGKTKCVAVLFHQLNSEIKHVEKWMVCECFTVLFQFVRRQLLWTWFFPPWCSYCVAHEVSLLTGHRGNELISLSTQIVCFCYSCHISVRCGSSSSWNNEAMFHD